MGIVALDTDLDSAIHILNYRLSTCTSDTVSDIFKYRIALLTKKVTKIQKKVADVVSPLSVLNSFTSLMVKDAEDKCTVDNVPTPVTTIRKSREGPKKGLAGDSKKAVLNSLLTPFDHSKSPESVNPEEPVHQQTSPHPGQPGQHWTALDSYPELQVLPTRYLTG